MEDSVASLNLTSDPPGARIFLNGEARGVTPAQIDRICSGKVRLEVKHSTAGKFIKDLVLTKDDAISLDCPIRPTLAFLGVEAASAGGQRFVAEADEKIRAGHHVVFVTGTASGKTLCYNLPIPEAVLSDPEACALYLFPTKALAQDQLRQLREIAKHCPGLPVAHTYDADVSRATRDRVRRESRLLLSNPDMVHVNLLPNHTRWSRFLAREWCYAP